MNDSCGNVEIEKKRYFQPISRFFSEMIQDRAILQCLTNTKSYMIYRTTPYAVTLNKP